MERGGFYADTAQLQRLENNAAIVHVMPSTRIIPSVV
jgi:hypothetical protein